MSRNPLRQRLIDLVEPAVVAAGFELVDLRFLLEQGGWVLRVQIGLPLDPSLDAEGRAEVADDQVDIADCEEMSRELSAVIDVDDPIPQAYSLEVSSPGIDRPLRTASHFRYFAGDEAKISLAVGLQLPADERSGARARSVAEGRGGAIERKNFRGKLVGASDTHVQIDCDGQRFELAIADIETARLVPDWDEVMKGRSGVGARAPKPVKPGHRPSKHKHQEKQG